MNLHHQLIIDNYQIHVHERTTPSLFDSAPTFVFLHGISLDSTIWSRQFDRSILATYRLIAIDLPGHGLSRKSATPLIEYRLDRLVDLVNQIVDLLKVPAYKLIGLSLGGTIALNGLQRLKNCTGIVAMSVPLVKPIPADQLYQNPVFWLNQFYREDISEQTIQTFCQVCLRPNTTVIPDWLSNAIRISDPNFRSAILAFIWQGLYEDEVLLLQDSRLPVAILLGAEDQIYNLAYASTLSLPTIWRNAIQFIPNAGHLLPYENPEAVNQLLVEFEHQI